MWGYTAKKIEFFVNFFSKNLRGGFKQVGVTIFRKFILVGIVNLRSTRKQSQKLLNIKSKDLNGKKGGSPELMHLTVANL